MKIIEQKATTLIRIGWLLIGMETVGLLLMLMPVNPLGIAIMVGT